MSVDLRLMRYVIAVSESGSFEQAAERLHMTQPPLSRQIRTLERELGVRLFHRRPLRLTEPGRVFVEAARQIIDDTERAVEHTTGFHEMPKLLAAVREEHPDMRIDASEAWDCDLGSALMEGRLDVVVGRHLPIPSSCTQDILRRDRYAIVVGRAHRLAERESVLLRELRGEHLLFFPRSLAPRYHDTVLAALHSAGETFETWENPLPGLRNLNISLRDHGFMVLPSSLRSQLSTGVAWLGIRDAMPPVDLALSWNPDAAPSAVYRFARTATRLARRERWTVDAP